MKEWFSVAWLQDAPIRTKSYAIVFRLPKIPKLRAEWESQIRRTITETFVSSGQLQYSVRNNGRTSDIYRPNEAFVRPFVISPDILSGGVAAGVEFCMSNPHPRTSQRHVNKHSFRSLCTKQMQTAARRTCTCTV